MEISEAPLAVLPRPCSRKTSSMTTSTLSDVSGEMLVDETFAETSDQDVMFAEDDLEDLLK